MDWREEPAGSEAARDPESCADWMRTYIQRARAKAALSPAWRAGFERRLARLVATTPNRSLLFHRLPNGRLKVAAWSPMPSRLERICDGLRKVGSRRAA